MLVRSRKQSRFVAIVVVALAALSLSACAAGWAPPGNPPAPHDPEESFSP